MRKVLDLKIHPAECCSNCKHVLDNSHHSSDGVDEVLYCKLLLEGGLPRRSSRGDDASVDGNEVCRKFLA